VLLGTDYATGEEDSAAGTFHDEEEERLIGDERAGHAVSGDQNDSGASRFRSPFVDVDDGFVDDVIHRSSGRGRHTRQIRTTGLEQVHDAHVL